MKQAAANYVVTHSGLFLKNGIATLGEDGIAAEFTDTGGDLQEIALLIFYNGILFPNFQYLRIGQAVFKEKSPEGLQSITIGHLNEFQTINVSEFIKLGILIQNTFPEMTIPEIVKGITENLAVEGNFIRQSLPGFILLQGADLVHLKFTAKCRSKQII
jgi:hypothetical protein